MAALGVHLDQAGAFLNHRTGVVGDDGVDDAQGFPTFGIFGVLQQLNQSSAVAASAGRMCLVPITALETAARVDRRVNTQVATYAVQTCGRIAAWAEAMRVRGLTNQLAYALLLLSETQHQSAIRMPTQVVLADLLGATRESVARALAIIEDEGGISREENRKTEVHGEALLKRLQGS